MSNLSSLSFYIPELIIIASVLLLIIFDIVPSLKGYTFQLSLGSIILASISLLFTININDSLFMGMIAIDPFSHFFKFIFLFTSLSIVIVSNYDKQLDKNISTEYNALLLIVVLGLFLMSSSVNLLMIYLSVELVSIPSYILAGIRKNDKESNEASLKYVIFGSFASGLMLFGLSLLYGLTGSMDIFSINAALMNAEYPLTVFFPLALLLSGFGYKISMVPFHFWTPDVYEGAPTPVTAFLSVAPKAAGLALLTRVFYTLFTSGDIATGVIGPIPGIDWPIVIAFASAITMTVGNFLAIRQEDVKRILAYSSISHVGFMLMAFPFIGAGSLRAIMLYLFIYLFMNLSAFYMVIFASNKLDAHEVSDWKGLGKRSPLLSAFMVLSLLSLTGLPPTSGFVGKVYIFAELFKFQKYYWLAIVAILNSVVSLYYYFKIVKAMYLEEYDGDESSLDAHPAIKWSIIVFSSQSILFFIYWQPLVSFIDNSIKFWNG